MLYKKLTDPPYDKKLQEEELISALKNHDESAVKYVYQTYWPVILKLVKLNSGSEAEAKDLFQECMLDFLEKIWSPKFVLTCKLGTYLYSIGRNKWLYALRSRQKIIDIADFTDIEELPEQKTEDDVKLPHDEQIKNAVIALGEPCRSLLIGFYYEELSMERLAMQLNYKSVNVAKQQKFRCKDRLKQAFSEFF